MLLFQPLGFPSVLREGRSEGRGSECKHVVCSLKPFPVALGLLKVMYPFITIGRGSSPATCLCTLLPPHWGFSTGCPHGKEWKG